MMKKMDRMREKVDKYEETNGPIDFKDLEHVTVALDEQDNVKSVTRPDGSQETAYGPDDVVIAVADNYCIFHFVWRLQQLDTRIHWRP
jgi:hypothetical protein